MIQQLDLFGGQIPQHEPKPKSKKPINTANDIVVENVEIIPEEKKTEDVSTTLTEIISVNEKPEKQVETSTYIRPKPSIIVSTQFIEENIINKKDESINKIEKQHKTALDEPIKRKRGRPRKEKSIIDTPKIKLKRGRKPLKDIVVDVDFSNVPSDDELDKKLYYPIGLVAKWFNVTGSQLRFWENEFDILKPKKNGKGNRLFRPEDIRNIKTIYYLLRKQKLSLQGVKEYFKTNQQSSNTNLQIISSLQNIKSALNELKNHL